MNQSPNVSELRMPLILLKNQNEMISIGLTRSNPIQTCVKWIKTKIFKFELINYVTSFEKAEKMALALLAVLGYGITITSSSIRIM